MGGFGSGRFGKRSHHLFNHDVLRLALADLAKASAFESLDRAVGVAVGAEVEIVAEGTDCYRSRCHVGTRTGNDPRHWPRSSTHVPASAWMDTESCFIELALQRQKVGGHRIWFVCPRDCGRKCSILVRPPDTTARAFACRKCYDLRYRSQRLGKGYRLDARAESILTRLTREDGEVTRPKGMHVRTFDRMCRSAAGLIDRSRAARPAFP